MREEQALAKLQQRFSASHVPDFALVSKRLRALVGAKAARDLFSNLPEPSLHGGVRWATGNAAQLIVSLDSMSEMGELTSLRLQMAMDRTSKFIETLSNLLEKISDTSSQITQNIK